MTQLISYLKSWYFSKTDTPFGLLLVSIYVIILGTYILVKTIASPEALSDQSIINVIIISGMVISGIGLIFKQGWAWNFAIALYSYSLVSGLLSVLGDFLFHKYVGSYPALIVGIIVHLIINTPVLIYLSLKRIRQIYPKSHISLFIIGFSLVGYTWTDHSEFLSGVIEGILMIVGIAIVAKAGRDLRKDVPL